LLCGNNYQHQIVRYTLQWKMYGQPIGSLINGKLQSDDTMLDISGSLVRTHNEKAEYLQLSALGSNLDTVCLLFDVTLLDGGTVSGKYFQSGFTKSTWSLSA